MQQNQVIQTEVKQREKMDPLVELNSQIEKIVDFHSLEQSIQNIQ